jgi:SPX domain protein involved in polyphosphate accumulation
VEIKKIFRRYEQKYVISEEIAEAVIEEAKKHMADDPFGETDIMNIYYDTPDNRLIRNSLEKPTLYKEKLRLRCYGVPKDDSKAFVELKKKYDSVVYKRRITLP